MSIPRFFLQNIDPCLRLLNLANNRLRRVSAVTFRGLTQLRTLILSHNQIVYWHQNILPGDLVMLSRLYLTGNLLKLFPRSTDQLKVIHKKRKGEMHWVSNNSELLAIGGGAITVMIISLLIIIKLSRKYLSRTVKDLREGLKKF